MTKNRIRRRLRPIAGQPAAKIYSTSQIGNATEYTVQIQNGEAVCDCPAGAHGRNCIHRDRFIKNEIRRIRRGISALLHTDEIDDCDAQELSPNDLAAIDRMETERAYAGYNPHFDSIGRQNMGAI